MLPQLSSSSERASIPARPLLILKLGGDAVATPERIALAARLVCVHAATADVVVVTSARRGVTDQLTQLAAGVGKALGMAPNGVETERAIAAGEIVTAALMAAALTQLGCPATSLDAREAGLRGRHRAGGVSLTHIRTAPIRRVLAAGTIPVVAGFQVLEGTRLRILGRGGSDITAVALAAALGAAECHFLKQWGLRESDPRIDSNAPHIDQIDFAALTRILSASGQVLHPEAARLAARHHVTLHFVPFPDPGPTSRVSPTQACAM